MNLLLYAEARQTLAGQRGEAAHDSNPLPELPDSLFEELGYYGALDTDETDETDPGEDLGELFRWFIESPDLTRLAYAPSGFHSHDVA